MPFFTPAQPKILCRELYQTIQTQIKHGATLKSVQKIPNLRSDLIFIIF